MRRVSRRLFNILNNDDFESVDFLRVQLVGQDPAQAFRFTNFGRDVTWDGDTWYAVEMTRGENHERVAASSGEVPALSVTVENVDRQMAKVLHEVEVEGSEATWWYTDRRLVGGTFRDCDLLTQGDVRNLTLTDRVLTFDVVNILGQTERENIPRRIYGYKCGYMFGASGHCGVDVNSSPVAIATTLLAGSTEKYLVVPSSVLAAAGNPEDLNDFWGGGFAIMRDGRNGLQQRPFHRVEQFGSELRFYLHYELMNPPNVNDRVTIRQQCNRTKEDCAFFHGGSADQYGGYAEVPPGRFKPTRGPGT